MQAQPLKVDVIAVALLYMDASRSLTTSCGIHFAASSCSAVKDGSLSLLPGFSKHSRCSEKGIAYAAAPLQAVLV